MKQKKWLIVGILCIFAASVAFGATSSNQQKIYRIDCKEYEQLSVLYRLAGLAMPSSSGPWSNSELCLMAGRIDRNSLSSEAVSMLDALKASLQADNAERPSFDAGMTAGLQVYAHSNTDYFTTREKWISSFSDQLPVLAFDFQSWLGDGLYLWTRLPVQLNGILYGSEFGSTKIISNIPLVPPSTMKDIDFNFPYRSFISMGGDWWNVEVGRDRLSWGLGETGNLIIGDHVEYHNMARAAAYSNNFKYTFLASFFPHPQNYYHYETEDPIKNGYYEHGSSNNGQSSYLNGISMFLGHRFEWRLFSGKLGLAVTEGIMYMSKDNKLDLISLNPAMFWHNNYTRSLTNSILGFELDWAVYNGLNLYGSMVVDESPLPGEAVPGKSSEAAEPNGLGFIAGARYSAVTGSGYWTLGLEGAYTTPYLYLRDGDSQSGEDDREQTKGRYGINYVIAVREMSQTGGTQNFKQEFLGYQYGCDAIVGNLNCSFASNADWNLEGNLFYMAHGTHDENTIWTRVNTTYQNVTTPTTSHQTGNQADDDVSDRDSVCHTFVAGINGSMDIIPGLNAFAQADYIMIVHPGNVSTAATQSDIQLTVGISYEVF